MAWDYKHPATLAPGLHKPMLYLHKRYLFNSLILQLEATYANKRHCITSKARAHYLYCILLLDAFLLFACDKSICRAEFANA